uniref:Protein kinase domain-containing protein n=1 Tax=Rhizophora mucronata TaxID=61149 RepID=A0A2P2PKA8_RHIMU
MGHLKIGEYWVQMFYRQIHTNQENSMQVDSDNTSNCSNSPKGDIWSFGVVFYQMLEGRQLISSMNLDAMNLRSVDFKPTFPISRCAKSIQQFQ